MLFDSFRTHHSGARMEQVRMFQKLIIQVPCYNEASSLPVTLAALPRQLPGIAKVELLIVDDGSQDETISIARQFGVEHIVRHPKNLGLARAFMTGIHSCIRQGADVIVNTDADNQYDASCIPDLIAPILSREAEIVIGARETDRIAHFTFMKKLLQKIGSWVVRRASKTNIPDAPSGFRAFTRDAALKLNVFNNYTYTLETIIQAGQKSIPITWIPIRTNDELRPSRLFNSNFQYVRNSLFTIVRIFVVYKPFRFFLTIGTVLCSIGGLIGLRFLWLFLHGEGDGHIQSLILTGILIGMGFQVCMVAFVADLQSANRRLLEELQYKQRISDCVSPETSLVSYEPLDREKEKG